MMHWQFYFKEIIYKILVKEEKFIDLRKITLILKQALIYYCTTNQIRFLQTSSLTIIHVAKLFCIIDTCNVIVLDIFYNVIIFESPCITWKVRWS